MNTYNYNNSPATTKPNRPKIILTLTCPVASMKLLKIRREPTQQWSITTHINDTSFIILSYLNLYYISTTHGSNNLNPQEFYMNLKNQINSPQNPMESVEYFENFHLPPSRSSTVWTRTRTPSLTSHLLRLIHSHGIWFFTQNPTSVGAQN